MGENVALVSARPEQAALESVDPIAGETQWRATKSGSSDGVYDTFGGFVKLLSTGSSLSRGRAGTESCIASAGVRSSRPVDPAA